MLKNMLAMVGFVVTVRVVFRGVVAMAEDRILERETLIAETMDRVMRGSIDTDIPSS